MERILKTELEQEISDIKADIERLKNPSPPPLVQIKEERPVEFFKPISVNPATTTTSLGPPSHAAVEDESTRMSEVTDSRSMCDMKSESGQFGWQDDEWSDDDEDEDEEMTSAHHSAKKMKCEDDRLRGSSGSGFDIEAEILPNFILNMKKNGRVEDELAIKKEEEESAPVAVAKDRVLSSPASSVKSEAYDEWTSLQRELASMDQVSTAIPSIDQQNVEKDKNRGYNFDKVKKPWSNVQESSTTTITESCVGQINSASGGRGLMGSTSVQQQHLTTVKQSIHSSSQSGGNANFFSLETSSNHSESWLDFQHNNNSFDFPIGAVGGSSGGQINGTSVHNNPSTTQNQQANVVSQKRSWNGFVSNDSNGAATGGGLLNGGSGGPDDFYNNKKMCYGTGDFDFQQLIMGSSGGHHQSTGQFGNNGSSGGGVLDQQHQQSHSQSHFDEDINRQMQSAIDSILNLQGTDTQDFHFNLDPAMGALLGGGDSSSGHGGGGLMGQHHQQMMGNDSGLRMSTNSPAMMRSMGAMGDQNHLMGQAMSNSYHNSQQQQQSHHGGGGAGALGGRDQSMVSHSMMFSDDDEDDDEHQRAIKSVLMS